jgi:hypothetical protein
MTGWHLPQACSHSRSCSDACGATGDPGKGGVGWADFKGQVYLDTEAANVEDGGRSAPSLQPQQELLRRLRRYRYHSLLKGAGERGHVWF